MRFRVRPIIRSAAQELDGRTKARLGNLQDLWVAEFQNGRQVKEGMEFLKGGQKTCPTAMVASAVHD
jgi:hypothetical protein